jgi:hypothetical protein
MRNNGGKYSDTPMPGLQTTTEPLRLARNESAALRAQVGAAQAAAASKRDGRRLSGPVAVGGLKTVDEGNDQDYQATTPEARDQEGSGSEDGDFDPAVAAPSKPGSGAGSR